MMVLDPLWLQTAIQRMDRMAESPKHRYQYNPRERINSIWPTRIEIEMRAAIEQAAKDDNRITKKAKRARLRAAMVRKGRTR